MAESVAVVIPAHNRSDLLRITLRNVLCQEGIDLQIAVVDDGSRDDTPAVIAEFASRSSQIVSERFETPQGACAARNRGLELTDASYVCFLDSDDLLHPEKLGRQVSRLRANPDLDLTVCQMAHFIEDPSEAELLWNTFAGNDPWLRFLGHDPVWGIHAPLWRRAALERIGGFAQDLPMAQDFELHARALAMGCRVELTPDLLTYCRRHEGPSISASRQLARLRTILGVFESLAAQRGQLSPEESQILLGDYLWIANLASVQGEGELMARALTLAQRQIGVWSPKFVRFALLSRSALITKRHRFYALARKAASSMGHDLSSREGWYHRHRIADEPGIVLEKMPGSCWRE